MGNADAPGGGGTQQNRWAKFMDAPGGSQSATAERPPYVPAQSAPACQSQNTQSQPDPAAASLLSPPVHKELRNPFSHTPATLFKAPQAASAAQERSPPPKLAPVESSMPYVGNPFPSLGKRPPAASAPRADPPKQAMLAKFTSQASVPPPASRGALHSAPSAPRSHAGGHAGSHAGSHAGAPSGRGGKAPGAALAPKQSFW